ASSTLQAQNIQLGAKAGMAITNFVGDRDTEFDAKMNFVGGFPLSYPINRNLLLTPEILYAAKGADALATVDGVPLELSFSVIYLEFPLLAKYVLSPRKRVSPILTAGPVVSWNIDARVRYNAVGSDIEFNDRDDSIETLDYGVAVGGGVDFSWDLRKITVELRYTRGVSNLIDDDDDPKRNGVVALTAGVGL
ncbi:MAG TPA: porin family protein, partial [Rhodothermales bacterium]|nr:porin family protein [Rhodothermales bacterium]